MADNIRLLSELFDMGNKKSKAIKDSERQDAEVTGMGMNALFVGSEDNIVLDKSVALKFRTEFITKLARRSMFVYPSKSEFDECVIEYSTYEQMKEKEELFEALAAEGKAYIASATNDIALTQLERDSRLIGITDEALTAFKDYKLYTNNLGAGMNFVYKTVQLELTHRSWKMLKLAGVYAIWDMEEMINIKHIKDAIYFVEKISPYIEAYEEYAAKDAYELTVEFFRHNPDASLTLHDLKKRGFISGTSGIEHRIKELVRLADSFAGAEGSIKFANDIMSYKPFEAVGDHYASYIKVSGTKQERASQCHSGFKAKSTTFDKIKVLLENDTAYTPFRFNNGQRKNDNIISGATWVALDIDDGDVDIYEMHSILGDYNHHISTTSNRDNIYKYRIIIEFNNIVDLPPREWKAFGKVLAEELGVKIDPATFVKSQIMFGYKGALVLTELKGEKYDISHAYKTAQASVASAFNKDAKPTRTQKRTMIENPLDTFGYCFNAEEGKGSLAMYRMVMHAFDLGASLDEIEQIVQEVNYEFWDTPMDEDRLRKTILDPIRRKFKSER